MTLGNLHQFHAVQHFTGQALPLLLTCRPGADNDNAFTWRQLADMRDIERFVTRATERFFK